MLSTRMTDCAECSNIIQLILSIDCKLTELSNTIYNKLIYALNGPCLQDDMAALIHYRRILVHKWCNDEYASSFTFLDIASKVMLITSGCLPQPCCDECKEETTTTTTTSTTVEPTTTTTTSTTTTLPVVECNDVVGSGGAGITEFTIPLETGGGVLILDFIAYSIPDKLEILHNGIKVATTGSSDPSSFIIVNNEGPFDDVYGDPAIPTIIETMTVDQFIGHDKGTPPKREAELFFETGISYTAVYQQLVWFKYESFNVDQDPNALIRVTGPEGTVWNFLRYCPSETTTTTTTEEEIYSISMKSTSTSSNWSPYMVTTGEVLDWTVTGGVTIPTTTITNPSFNFSGNTGTADILVEKGSQLTVISVGYKNLTELIVSGATDLDSLGCSNNQLTTLNVSKNKVLTILSCDANQLTSLNLNGAELLTYSYCDNNQLTTLDISTNSILSQLYCNDNLLTTLNLGLSTSLTSLNCFNNQLTILDISAKTNLLDLQCEQNFIITLNVSNHPSLRYLSCYGNNQSPSVTDQIFIDLDANGAVDGGLHIRNNRTPASDVAYNNLLNVKNWTIDDSYTT